MYMSLDNLKYFLSNLQLNLSQREFLNEFKNLQNFLVER
jgi:hypothetical protein